VVDAGPRHEPNHECNQRGQRHTEHEPDAEVVLQSLRDVREVGAVRQKVGHPRGDPEHGECRDQRVHPKARHNETVDEPDAGTGAYADQRGQEAGRQHVGPRAPAHYGRHLPAYHGGEQQVGAKGNVKLA